MNVMMMTLPDESAFQLLPIQAAEGFPQAFQLSFAGKLYYLTFSISFLTFAPFKMNEDYREEDGNAKIATASRRSLSVPLSVAGPRAQLPWDFQSELERMVYTLPQESLYLIMKLERGDLPQEQRLLGITRPVLDVPFRLGDLMFLFKKISIARGNLLGPGDFGSEIVAGVMTYDG